MGRPHPSHNPAGYGGLGENLRAFISALLECFETRLQVAAQDSKRAGVRVAVAIAGVLVAAVSGLFGYITLLIFAIIGIAHLLGIWWIWIALAAALLHFAVALFGVILARAQLKGPFFHDTRSVLKEDSEWLKNLNHG
jgi:uncharacterized membrane protein YqjE